jgi:SnoaL-like domain
VRFASIALVLASLLVAGCDSDSEQAETQPASTPSTEERIVRAWITALNEGDYDRAARYFAKGAIVDQGRPIKLPNAAAARFFNRSLPCRAELVDVDDEPGPRALASFTLSEGPGGPCEGRARVRVTVKDGLFTEWRQLPEGPEPSGPVV